MNLIKNILLLLLIFQFNSTLSCQYYDLTNSLPKKYVKNGTVDYTSYLQEGIYKHKKVMMPDFPILINSNGLRLIDNSTVYFQKKSTLMLIPNNKEFYAILNISNVKNVTVKNPRIIGDKDTHSGKKGEWGMGIYIDGSQNINILSANISDCWGDGIYIGGNVNAENKNIIVKDSKISDCRRNGISITHGNYIHIENTKISDISGTAPMAGIDIEPNNSKSTINNIYLNNITTSNVKNFGIEIELIFLLSNTSKPVNININNHIDYGSNFPLFFGNAKNDVKNTKKLNGTITINNSKWYDYKNSMPLNINKNEYRPIIKVRNLKLYEQQKSKVNNTYKIKSVQKTDLLQKIKNKYNNNNNITIE